MPRLYLFCGVHGDPDAAPFGVKMEKDETVDDLKKYIQDKKRPEFDHFAPDRLKLWKWNKPTDKFGELNIKNVLDPRHTIGDVFKDDTLRKGWTHIIIKVPASISPSSFVESNLSAYRKRKAETPNVGALHYSAAKRLKTNPGEDKRLPSEASLKSYHTMLQQVSANSQWYSDPRNFCSIPFPCLFHEPPERFSIQDGKFEYMGRTKFRDAHSIVSSLTLGAGCTRLYIQGTMGYGKSHILAALTCLLYRQEKPVVFIPDLRAMLRAPVPYVKIALLCTFAGPTFKEERKQIRACESMADISSFYHGLDSFPYLIIDQINAFELSDVDKDSIPNERKNECRLFIDDLTSGSYTITSASANYETAMHMEKKQTGEHKLSMTGGMSTEEMEQWWHHHEDKLPKFETCEERVEVEDLTGCIPLLLQPLLQFSQKTYRAVEEYFWACPEIGAVRQNIEQFSESKRKIGEREYNDYIETLCSCIMRGSILGHSNSSFDYQYFYCEDRKCGYTCGLAREAATSVIAQRKRGKFYEAEWIGTLRFYKNNPSALGIQTELICLACIADMGLNFGDVHVKSKVPIYFMGNLNGLLDVIPSNPQPGFSQLYLSENPRFEDIDAAYIEYRHETNTVHVVPIQVTINARHKDSETLFYNKWAKWESKFSEYELSTTFVWIVENKIRWDEIEEEIRKTRKTTQVITRKHNTAIIPLVNVHVPLAKELAWIRKGTS